MSKVRLRPLAVPTPAPSSGEEGIGLTLLADGAHGTVAADEDEVVAERDELRLDGLNEGGVIPIGEVGAPDGASEQHVANEGKALRSVNEHHRARRVAGAVQHREAGAGVAYLVALLKPAIGCDVARTQEPHGKALCSQAVEQELIGDVRTLDGDAAELLLQFGGAGSVIDVPVGEQDLVDPDAGLFYAGLDAVEITTGIDDGARFGCLVPQQGAVLLKRCDGNDGGFKRHV